MPKSDFAPVRLGPGGRVLIPAAYRKALKVEPGDEVVLQLKGGELRLYSRAEALRRFQDLVCRVVPEDVSLSDELIEERKREAAGE